MALEKDSASGDFNNNSNMDTVLGNEKINSGSGVDSEKGTKTAGVNGRGKKMGRIAPVLPHLSGYGFGTDDSDGDVMLGKQLEMEADNAIKYRTCSWQKVRLFLLLYFLGQFSIAEG